MSNLYEYAQREMDHAWPPDKRDEMQSVIVQNILDIVKVFCDQGHSGMSAPYVIAILKRVLNWKPISPLTGEDDEWRTVHGCDGDLQQNIRCSCVFRNNHDNSTAHNVEGRVFSDDGGQTFYSCKDSSVPVKFPYYPPDHPEKFVLKEEKDENH